jgi:transposase
MTEHVEGSSREQIILLPDRLDDYVDVESPVRFIDAFVDSLDLEKLGFKRVEPSETGRPSYDPVDLLKLYVYGYLNHIRTSRKLERECHRNLEVVWLMRRLTPDFKTIADFRKDNIGCVKPVFKEFVYLCESMNLFGCELVGIDGVKLDAVNSNGRNFDKKKLINRLKRIDEAVERYLNEIEERDSREAGSLGEGEANNDGRAEHLREKLKKLEKRKEEYTKLLEELKESGKREVSLTDPDSRLMKNNGKMEVCYNTLAAVDSKNKLIADYDVTNIGGDNNQLSKIAKSTKETLGVEKIDVTADRGFFNTEEIKDCLDNGITPYVPMQKFISARAKSKGIPASEFYKDKFTYDRESDTYTCPAGQRLEFMHVMSVGRGKIVREYGTKACSTCPFFMTRCTTNRDGRKIYRLKYEEIINEMKERLKLEPSKVEIRKELCEHPFGTIKRAFNQGYLLLKGLRKVTGEVGFTMLAYDMRRALNILGTRMLIASLS